MPTPSESNPPLGPGDQGAQSDPAEPNPPAGTPGRAGVAGATPVPVTGNVAGTGAASSSASDKAPHYTPVPGAKKYKLVGVYDIVSKLGQGAMGSVYLAKNMITGRQVALKILPPDLARDEELLERFKREARATQRLSHPNIVSAVEFGTFEKYHYIAMDYVDGPDLETLLKKTGPFTEETLLNIASAMCSALEEIERHGIVHRDFKPSNIMMSSKGIYRLTDLGLASAGKGDQRLTLAGFAVGTPYYLSPEQARGQLDVDIRADIYGLGATLYHLATGDVPFPGSNPIMVMTQHISTPLRPPHEANASVSKHVSALICLMMEKDVDKRPQNTVQLREVVVQCQNGHMPGSKSAEKAHALAARLSDKLAAMEKPWLAYDVEGALDKFFSFLPQSSRLPAAIATLAMACIAMVAVVIMLLRR